MSASFLIRPMASKSARDAMKTDFLRALGWSICLHAAAAAAFWRVGPVEGNGIQGRESAVRRQVLAVRLVPQAQSAEFLEQAPKSTMPANHDSRPVSTTSVSGEESGVQAADTDDYVPAGKLTRMPAPLGDVHFGEFDIDPSGLPASIEIGLLIEASGLVSDVVAQSRADKEAVFLERIADRFKRVRFSPGEIDGRPVRSQVQVIIVIETEPGA
jgi:hypothetical protein